MGSRMARTTWVAIVLVGLLSGCRPNRSMALCKKAELAGVLVDCWEFEGGRGRATDVAVANDVQVGRVFIAAYSSDATYEADLRNNEVGRSRCLHGNAHKRIIVTADMRTAEDVCRAVYDVVDRGE
jgi:hypothetical protein